MIGSRALTVGLLVPVFSAAISVAAQAQPQKRNSPSAASRRNAILSRENDLQNRELNIRHLAKGAKARPASEQQLTIKQVLEDFQRLQLDSSELRLSVASNTVDYKRISGLAGEINKRAKRLKTNLMIPPVETSKDLSLKVETGGQDLKSALPVLADLVKSFVTNPLFNNLKVTQVKHLERAQQDIAGVIDLSQAIRKAADRLK